MLYNLVVVRGKETFGLTLWAESLQKAMAKARHLLIGSGYAIHPVK